MKKIQALTALTLSAALLLSACSSGGGAAQKSPTASQSENKPYTVKFAVLGNTVPRDIYAVAQKISDYTVKKINVKVDLLPLTFGNYQQQINLMISSSEKLDLMTEMGSNLSSDVAKNQLEPLDDLLNSDGKDAKSALGDYVKACQINGKTYALPSIRDMASSYGIILVKPAVDAAHVDPSKIKTYDDLSNAFAAMKKNRPNKELVTTQAVSISAFDGAFVTFDKLGDGFGVLMNWGDNFNVVNLYETPYYKQSLKTIRDWYLKGYIFKDAATNSDSAGMNNTGNNVGSFCTLKPGVEQQAANLSGQPSVAIQLQPALETTAQVATVSTAIPITCADTQKTMQFLNLLYSDPTLINLIDFGIEGKHYAKTDVDNVIDYPEGVTSSTTGYGNFWGWEFGNQLLTYVWKGDDPKLYENLKTFNEGAKVSKAFGFTFDSSKLNTEYAAVNNVISQYKLPLEDGAVDVDTNLPKFITALKNAGIDKIIAAKQEQLNAWAKSQS